MNNKTTYKRVLLKLSGEMLAGGQGFGINETMLNEIRLYIQTNPARWAEDSDNPANFGVAPGSAMHHRQA